MNSSQRRKFTRQLDKKFTTGLLVYEKRTGVGYVVRARSNGERRDWDRVMVELVIKPFGHIAARYSDLTLREVTP